LGTAAKEVSWQPLARAGHYGWHVRLVIARCSVDYSGRLTAHLPLATRLILIKADGSVLIHSDTGTKALSWMPPGSRVSRSEVKQFHSCQGGRYQLTEPGGADPFRRVRSQRHIRVRQLRP
jgi:RecB family endonuclease NucS